MTSPLAIATMGFLCTGTGGTTQIVVAAPLEARMEDILLAEIDTQDEPLSAEIAGFEIAAEVESELSAELVPSNTTIEVDLSCQEDA